MFNLVASEGQRCDTCAARVLVEPLVGCERYRHAPADFLDTPAAASSQPLL
jgi:hypothetical protein